MSPGRSSPWSTRVAIRSASSPAAWPSASLSCSKPSTSRTTTATFSLRSRAASMRLVERVVQPAVVEHAGEGILEHEPVDPVVQRLRGAADGLERAGERADGVPAVPAERRQRLAGRERHPAGGELLDRPHEQPAGDRADADDQQQGGAGAGEQHLAPPGGERGRRARRARSRAAARRPGARDRRGSGPRAGRPSPSCTYSAVRGVRASGATTSTLVRSGCAPLSRSARARSRADAVQVARAQRLGEAACERRRLGLAGPAVRVGDRRDRAVAEEPAAGEHEDRGGGDQPASAGRRGARGRARVERGRSDMPALIIGSSPAAPEAGRTSTTPARLQGFSPRRSGSYHR